MDELGQVDRLMKLATNGHSMGSPIDELHNCCWCPMVVLLVL
jgi:hypothetical protein